MINDCVDYAIMTDKKLYVEEYDHGNIMLCGSVYSLGESAIFGSIEKARDYILKIRETEWMNKYELSIVKIEKCVIETAPAIEVPYYY